MSPQQRDPLVGVAVIASNGRRIGCVDAEFADYLLVRTSSLLPIDLYVPRMDVTEAGGRIRVDCRPGEARKRWHRPLKRAPHD